MKLFLGVPAQEKIVYFIQRWREDNKYLDVRWIEDENLHITLLPPWEEKHPEVAIQNLETLGPLSDIPIHFDSISLGSQRQNPNLIWLTGRAPLKLIYTKDRAEEIFQKPHRHHFKMHITLARLHKDSIPNLAPQKVSWSGVANSLVLYESLGYSQYRKLAQK